MNLEVRHIIPCPARTLWQLIFNRDFSRLSDEASRVSKEILTSTVEPDGTRVETMRFTSMIPLNAVVSKVVGADRLSYDQKQRIHDDTMTIEWEVFPMKVADKVKAQGTYRLRDVPGGCERLVEGVIEVRIMLVGGAIEQAVGNEIIRSYEANAQFALEWLRKGQVA